MTTTHGMAPGFIETRGLLAAIEAADAMLKAADVHLVSKDLAGGGLVTITISGEVSAVKASVDAAVAAIEAVDATALYSAHVIARPMADVSRIIKSGRVACNQAVSPPAEAEVEDVPAEAAVCAEVVDEEHGDQPTATERESGNTDPAPEAEPKQYTISELTKTTVSKLRKMAREMHGISLSEEEIKTATKRKLIEAIVKLLNR